MSLRRSTGRKSTETILSLHTSLRWGILVCNQRFEIFVAAMFKPDYSDHHRDPVLACRVAHPESGGKVVRMQFSRRYLEILNAPRGPETSAALLKMRKLVEKWADSQIIGRADARWLNARTVSHKTTVKASPIPGRPETVVELEQDEQDLARIAASSFTEFLSEVAESKVSGAGRLGVRVCPACNNLFVQEDVGRDKLVCSARCKFRLRRKAQKGESRAPVKGSPPGKRGGKSG